MQTDMQSRRHPLPSGLRRHSPALAAAQVRAREIPCPATDKKTLHAAAQAAMTATGVRNGAATVLRQLATVANPEAGHLVAYAANAKIAEATRLSLRSVEHAIARLVALGLVIPRPSPNNKRYPLRDETGRITGAFGLDLSPLLHRAAEFDAICAAVRRAAILLKAQDDEITSLKRQIQSQFECLLEMEATGSTLELEDEFNAALPRLPRRGRAGDRPSALAGLDTIHSRLNRLILQIETTKSGGSARENGGHIDKPKNQPTGCYINRSGEAPPVVADDVTASPVALRKKKEAKSGTSKIEIALVRQAVPCLAEWGLEPRRIDDFSARENAYRALVPGLSASSWEKAGLEHGSVVRALLAAYTAQFVADDLAGSGRYQGASQAGGFFTSCSNKLARGELPIAEHLARWAKRRLQ